MTQIIRPRTTWPPTTAPTAAPEPATEPAAEDRPSPKRRDPFFDNAKFLAILLVVSGHTIAYLQDVPVGRAAYLFIYMFHMPMFIVLTGYLSRSFTFSGGKARKLITNLGVPYVVFEVAYSIFDATVGGQKFKITLLDPNYLTWFLLALFLWRLSTPVWGQIRWPLAVAVAISLLSFMGSLPAELDMHRVFGLVPFYVLGLMLRREHFELLKQPRARIAGAAVLACGFLFAFTAGRHMSMEWIFWRSGHDTLNVGNVTGTLVRIGMLVCAAVLVFAFMAVVPARRTWFTSLGTATLYAYLLHGFFTRGLQFADVYKIDWLHSVAGVVLLVTVGLAVGTLLCTKPVVRTMRWALEPKMSWAFRKLEPPAR